MKAGWAIDSLESLCEEFTDGNWIESKNQSLEGIRLVQTGNVGVGKFKDRRDKARFINEETFNRLNCFEVLPGDCLISRLPEPVGRACEIPDTGDKMITAVDCSIVRVDKNRLSRDYFIYYSQSKNYLKDVEAVCSGTTRKRISRKKLGLINLPIPPLKEQKRIVAILDEAFEGLHRARVHTEANLQNANDLFASVLQNCFGKREQWQQLPLIDEVRFMDYRGKTPPKTPDGIRLITAKNVKRGYINTHPEEFMDKIAFESWMTRGTPQKGDVLFTTEAPLGHVATLNRSQPVVIGQRLITMHSSKKYFSNEFLKYSLMSPQMQKEIHLLSSGTTVVGIKSKLLKQIPLYFPKDNHLQKSIIKKCGKAFEAMNDLSALQNQKLNDLDDLRQSLLQKAFAGELT